MIGSGTMDRFLQLFQQTEAWKQLTKKNPSPELLTVIKSY